MPIILMTISETARMIKCNSMMNQRLHPHQTGAFTSIMLATMMGTTTMFMRPISRATGVRNSGSTTLSSTRPVDTVPVQVPNMAMVRSKFNLSMRRPRYRIDTTVKKAATTDITVMGTMYFITTANWTAMMVATS